MIPSVAATTTVTIIINLTNKDIVILLPPLLKVY